MNDKINFLIVCMMLVGCAKRSKIRDNCCHFFIFFKKKNIMSDLQYPNCDN